MTTHLEDLRRAELLSVLPWIPPRAKTILEIGAGAGWQARELTRLGFNVKAIDLAESHHDATGTFEVTKYDGVHIPFPDGSFDVVFSSNVLEHVRDTTTMQQEIHRVLASSGVAIHAIPTASWRFWTSVSHYGRLLTAGLALIRANPEYQSSGGHATALAVLETARNRPFTTNIVRGLISPAHGERGNPLTEWFYLRGRYWTGIFIDNGWSVISAGTNGLFYTGHSILHSRLTIGSRRSLSRFLGSACRIYVLKQHAGGECTRT